MNNPKLYTVKEAAKIVGVSTNTLYKYLDEDRIHAARGSALQGRFRIPESALEEFLGIKLSQTESDNTDALINRITESPISPISPTDRPTESLISPVPVRTGIPVKIARLLLVFALLAVLIDLFVSRSVSLYGSISRLIFLAVMLLLAYQEGGYRRG